MSRLASWEVDGLVTRALDKVSGDSGPVPATPMPGYVPLGQSLPLCGPLPINGILNVCLLPQRELNKIKHTKVLY